MKERPRPDHPGKERCFSRNECHVWLKKQWITVIFYDFLWYFEIEIQKRNGSITSIECSGDYEAAMRFEMFQDVSSHDLPQEQPTSWMGRWADHGRPLQTIADHCRPSLLVDCWGWCILFVYTAVVHTSRSSSTARSAVAEVSNIGNYRRGELLWCMDGRANPLMDRKVMVIFGVAVVTSHTTAGCSVV